MVYKVILMVSYFMQVKEVKRTLQAKDEQFLAYELFIVI
jgi:hypothetical protein